MAQKFKNMFVVTDRLMKIDYTTISYSKKDSIKYFMEGSRLTWKQAYGLGCRCKKYDVVFVLAKKCPRSDLNAL